MNGNLTLVKQPEVTSGGVMQSRWMSFVEATVNILVGYGIAVSTQILVFPIFGLQSTLTENLKIGAVFTAVSIVRSFALRRLFEKIRPQVQV